MAILILERD